MDSAASGREAASPQVVQLVSGVGQESVSHLALPPGLLGAVHPLEVQGLAGQPADDVDLESAAPQLAVAHVPRSGNSHRLYVPAEVFEERYEGSSLGELGAAKAVLEDQTSRLMIDFANHYLDSGGGGAEVTDPPETDEETGELIMPPGRDIHGLAAIRRTEVLPNGQLFVHSGLLPWDQYSSFYDAQDELFWVTHELSKRRKLSLSESAMVSADEAEQN